MGHSGCPNCTIYHCKLVICVSVCVVVVLWFVVFCVVTPNNKRVRRGTLGAPTV
jgi:hypothetical protein